MARAHVRYTVQDRAGNAIQKATVTLFLTGTSTLVTDLYTVASGGTVVAAATLLSNNQGEVEGWLDTAKTIDVQVSDTAHEAFYSGEVGESLTFSPFTETVEVMPPPEDIATQPGSPTFSGTVTFTADPVFAGPSGGPVHITGTETITGKKYFKGPLYWDLEAYGAVATLSDSSTMAANATARQNWINDLAVGGGIGRCGPGTWHFSDYANWSSAASVKVLGAGNPGGLHGTIWREHGTYNGRVLTATCIVEFTATAHTTTTIDSIAPPLSSADVGRAVTGTGIPASTTIATVAGGGASATLSQAATGSATGTLTLGTPYNVRLGDTSATAADVGSTWRAPGAGLFAPPYATLLNATGAQGPAADVVAVTGASLPAYTYNGGAGTITANANGALPAIDGVTVSAGNRILVKNGVAAGDNGIYTVTQVGDGSNPFILTRATDTISTGLAVNCLAGTKYFNTLWYFTGTTGHWAKAQGQMNYVESYVDNQTMTLKLAVPHTFYNQKGCQLSLAHHRVSSVLGGLAFENIRIELDTTVLSSFYGDVFSAWIAGNNSWGPFRMTDVYCGVPSGTTAPGKYLANVNLGLAINPKINVHTCGGRHGVIVNNHVNELNACKWELHVGAAIVGGAQTTNINGGYLEALSGSDPAVLLDWDGTASTSSETNIYGVWGADGVAGVTESSWARFAGSQLNIAGGHMATSDYGVTIAGNGSSYLAIRGTNGIGLGAGVNFLKAQTGAATQVQSAIFDNVAFPSTALVNASTNCLSGWARGCGNLADGSFGSTPSAWTLVNALTLSGTITITDAINMVLGSTTGTKIGTATTQKLGFLNATPVAQQANSVDLAAVLSNFGFRASGGNPPLNLGTGALTAGALSASSVTASAKTVHAVASQSAGAVNVTIDASAADLARITLTASQGGNTTTITNPTAGQLLTIEFIQNGTGGWTYSWPTSCRFAANTAPVASTAANRKDSVTFEYNGSVWEEVARSINVPVT